MWIIQVEKKTCFYCRALIIQDNSGMGVSGLTDFSDYQNLQYI